MIANNDIFEIKRVVSGGPAAVMMATDYILRHINRDGGISKEGINEILDKFELTETDAFALWDERIERYRVITKEETK